MSNLKTETTMENRILKMRFVRYMAMGMSVAVVAIGFMGLVYAGFAYGGLLAPAIVVGAWFLARVAEAGLRYVLIRLMTLVL